MIEFRGKTYSLKEAKELEASLHVKDGTNWLGKWGISSAKKQLKELIGQAENEGNKAQSTFSPG